MAKKRINIEEVSAGADMVNNVKPEERKKRSLVSETICTRVTPEAKAILEDLAYDQDISVSKYLEKLIKKHIKDAG